MKRSGDTLSKDYDKEANQNTRSDSALGLGKCLLVVFIGSGLEPHFTGDSGHWWVTRHCSCMLNNFSSKSNPFWIANPNQPSRKVETLLFWNTGTNLSHTLNIHDHCNWPLKGRGWWGWDSIQNSITEKSENEKIQHPKHTTWIACIHTDLQNYIDILVGAHVMTNHIFSSLYAHHASQLELT